MMQEGADARVPQEAAPVDPVVEAVKAVQFGDLNKLIGLIEARKVSANQLDHEGCSLLHWAAINNRLQIASHLIDRGADVNYAGGVLQETPIQWALRKHAVRMVHLLAERGSDLAYKDLDGLDCLGLAAQLNQLDLVFLFLSYGADANATDNDGITPLIRECQKRPPNVDMMRLLLRFGAKTELQDPAANNGQGALHTCISKGCGKAVLWTLLEAGASLSAKDRSGRTPLGTAMSYGDMTRIRFIMEAYVLRKIPVIIPALVPAISTWLFAFLVEWQGWLWGLLWWVGIFLLVLSPAGLGMVPTVEKMQPCGFAAGCISLLCLTFHIYFTPYLSPLAIFLGLAVQAGVIFTFTRAIFTPPRFVEQDTTRGELVQQILSCQPEKDGPTALAEHSALRICTTCLTDKSKGSMHCSQCNRCVIDLDHHCPFVNNCVAAGNRLQFMQFLIAAIVSIGYWILCCVLTTPSYCAGVKGPVHSIACVVMWHRGLAVCSVLAVMLWFWIAALFGSQLYLISAATTTYDMMQGMDAPAIQSISGAFDNVKHFFVTGEARRITSGFREAGRLLQSACRHGHSRCGHGHQHNHGYDEAGDMSMVPLTIGIHTPDDGVMSV